MNLSNARDELVEKRRHPGVRMLPLAVETVCILGVSYALVGWLV